MITLHIYLRVTPGREADLERLYAATYVPAISGQRGFRNTMLLRTYDAARSGEISARCDWSHEIDIAFESEEDRRAWVAGAEHSAAWPQVEALCAEITWQGFDVVSC